jgi:hypothetical protein
VRHGFVVSFALLLSELFGPLVELRGHFQRLLLRAAETDEGGGELVEVDHERKKRERVYTRSRSKTELLNRIGRNDFDAFHGDAGERFAAFATIAHRGRGVAQLAEHIVAFDQFTEGGVLAVQETSICKADEKLAASGIGIRGASHGENAAHVGTFIEFGFDLVPGTAGAPHGFLAGILGERIATLDHEAFDDAMKGGAVVKTFAGKCFEVLDGLWCDVRPKLHDHFACGSFDNGYFVGIAHDIFIC